MSTIKVNLNDYGKTLQNWAKLSLERKRKAVVRGLYRSIPDLVAASPVDTGLYAASWDVIERETSALLVNYAPYAGVIEWGARKHYCPIGPLLRWAKRVLQDGSQPNHAEAIGSTSPNSEGYSSEVWALAKYTQKKIAEEDTPGKHIMQNMIPQILENIRKELKNVERDSSK